MIANKNTYEAQNKVIFKKTNKKLPFIFSFIASITFLSTSLMASSFSSSEELDISEALSNPKVVKILSIDGGGIRGILPLYFLKKLEKEMGQPIAETFDVVAGTSTGGIIALGLTTPADPKAENPTPKYRPDDLIDLYSQHGDEIFGKKYKNWFNLGGLARPRYSSKGVEKVSKSLLGDAKLSDALTNVIVTSFATERYKPLVFNSHSAKRRKSKDFLAQDIAVGTSAAPTYFKPKKLQNLEGKSYTVIDGGVIMNDPTLMALASARKIYPKAQDFLVVSLGTGKAIKRISYNAMKKAGGIKWVKPLTSIMMDGAAASVDFQMEQFFPDEYLGQGGYKKRYFRFQPTILPADKSMDDVSKKHIQSLTLTAESALEDRKGEINSLVGLLKEMQQAETENLSMSENENKAVSSNLEEDFIDLANVPHAPTLIAEDEDLEYARGKSLLQLSTRNTAPRQPSNLSTNTLNEDFVGGIL